MHIRKIQPNDNKQVAALIRTVFDELEIPKTGTAYEDESLDKMYETYQQPNAVYFVVEHEQQILGCAGIAHLANADECICELQKMYFLSAIRGKGLGLELIEKCLSAAKNFGFEHCYLETMPFMHAAQKLYKKVGFEPLSAPMGATGHTSCGVWMLKQL